MSGFIGTLSNIANSPAGLLSGAVIPGVTDPLGIFPWNKPSSPHQVSADSTLATLYTQKWEDYVRQFEPEENAQIGLMSNSANEAEKRQGQQAVGASYSRAPQDYRLQSLGYGQGVTPQAMQSFTQRANTQQGLDKVTSYNRTVQGQQDRFYGSLTGFGPAVATPSPAGGTS